MCYRSSQRASLEAVKIRYGVETAQPELFEPFYHQSAFAHPLTPLIASNHPDQLQFFSWGLVPSWIKSKAQLKAFYPDTMNARAEDIYQTRSYKEAATSGQRCLIPVTGFFESHTYPDEKGKDKKIPFYIFVKSNEIFSFAGLWSAWCDQETGEVHNTYAVLTCEANSLLAKVHNTKKRMPLILSQGDERAWLEPGLTPGDVMQLVKPYPAADIEAYPVSKNIHSPKIDMNTPEALVENTDFVWE